MALAAAGCGYAQSRALAAACEGVSRNPGATDTIRIFIFLGLAFIEFLALLTFVVIMLLLFF
jgi:F-type H+-transporting ATPase subunit c